MIFSEPTTFSAGKKNTPLNTEANNTQLGFFFFNPVFMNSIAVINHYHNANNTQQCCDYSNSNTRYVLLI